MLRSFGLVAAGPGVFGELYISELVSFVDPRLVAEVSYFCVFVWCFLWCLAFDLVTDSSGAVNCSAIGAANEAPA